MNISIKTISHSSQQYETCGDWRFDENGDLNIFISDMKNWKYEALVAVHELCEVLICKDQDIKTETVDAFDIAFEKLREEHPEILGDMEPGNMITAPYYKEHQFATVVEKALAGALRVDWDEYDQTVNAL